MAKADTSKSGDGRKLDHLPQSARVTGGLPPGFSGGSPELWDAYMGESEIDPARPFPSAPDRGLLAASLALTQLKSSDTVVELGCGSSEFLTRMAIATGARVAGVDFSPSSLERTKRALRRSSIEDSGLVLGSIEDYVSEHLGEFDVVISFGLIEHFSDLGSIISQHFMCAKNGGRIFIAAPNLNRVNLAWVRRVAPSLLTWHRSIEMHEVETLVRSHGAVGVQSLYLGGFRLFANPDPSPGRRAVQPAAAKFVRKCVNGLGEAAYRVAPAASERLAGPRMSPFFAVACVKSESGDARWR